MKTTTNTTTWSMIGRSSTTFDIPLLCDSCQRLQPMFYCLIEHAMFFVCEGCLP